MRLLTFRSAATAAIYTPEGKKQAGEIIAYYKNNARVIKEELQKAGFTVYGGVNAPYIWLKTPNSLTSWEFFDALLKPRAGRRYPRLRLRPLGEKVISGLPRSALWIAPKKLCKESNPHSDNDSQNCGCNKKNALV